MKRILSIMLALAMVVALFALVACGEEPVGTTGSSTTASTTATTADSKSSDTTATTATTATTGTTATSATSDTVASSETTASTSGSGSTSTDDGLDGQAKHPDFMDVNFGGKTFKFAVHHTDDWDSYEIYKESTGDDDLITEGVISRNRIIENLYNCKIECEESDGAATLVSNDVAIGAYNYDFYKEQYQNTTYPSYCLNIGALDIDFTHSWWDQNFIETFGVYTDNGLKLYSISGNFDLISYDAIWAMFFNKRLYDTLVGSGKITTDLYETVRTGKWTLDVMMEMMQQASADANGDSKLAYADGDVFGFTTISNNYASYAFYFGVGGHGSVFDTNSKKQVAMSGDYVDIGALSSSIDKIIELWSSENTAIIGQTDTQNSVTNGQALFISECLAVAQRVDDEDPYFSIVPFPKANESQESYHQMVCNRAYALKVSAAVKDRTAIAQFLEVFGFHSQKILYPAYVNYYKTQCFCDEEAGEMLDIVLSTKSYDLGYFLTSAICGKASSFITSGKNQLSRAISGSAATDNSTIETRIKAIMDATN